MEKLITIKPLEISEVKIFTASPATNTRTKISKETALKFTQFNETKRGAIEEEELLAIKPDLNTSTLPHFEEILTVDKLEKQIDKVNRILKKYGYTNLYISLDNLKNLLGSNNDELLEEIEFLKKENSELMKENIALKSPQEANPFLLPEDEDEIELEDPEQYEIKKVA